MGSWVRSDDSHAAWVERGTALRAARPAAIRSSTVGFGAPSGRPLAVVIMGPPSPVRVCTGHVHRATVVGVDRFFAKNAPVTHPVTRRDHPKFTPRGMTA